MGHPVNSKYVNTVIMVKRGKQCSMAWQAISIIRVYNVFPWCYSIFEDLCQIRQVRQVQNLNCYNGYFTPHGTYKLKPPASTCQHLFLKNTWQNFHVKSLEIIPVMSYQAWGSWWRVATSCTYIALYGAFVRVVDKTLTPQSLDYPYGLPALNHGLHRWSLFISVRKLCESSFRSIFPA